MGQEEEQEERARAFQGYIVDEELMQLRRPEAPSSSTACPRIGARRCRRR